MPIPLFNSIASWFLKKRYHQIELFLKYPEEVQQEVLHQLLDISKDNFMKILIIHKSITILVLQLKNNKVDHEKQKENSF